MRRVLGLLALVFAVTGVPEKAHAVSAWPAQLDMRVPFEPTAFPSDGRNYLCYELYLTNFGSEPISIRRLDVMDPSAKGTEPIASFEAGQLEALAQTIGPGGSGGGNGGPQKIAPGTSVLLFLWISTDPAVAVPTQLIHRVFTLDSQIDGAIVGTHHTKLRVLAPPVQGANWLASDGPSNDPDNHHRRGVFVFDGHAGISRRYAIDWMQSENGALFSGDPLSAASYFSYGKPVLAVAEATVVTVRDGLPDNVPGHNEQYHPAVPITPQTVLGNTITLDLGEGQFAHYAHLKPGSLRVKPGDRVRRGQVLAQIGDSGDARGPHLHFQLSTSPAALAGEGVPYLIDGYRKRSANSSSEMRMREIPLKDMLIDFGP